MYRRRCNQIRKCKSLLSSEFQKSKDVDIQRPHYIFQSEEALSVTPKATPHDHQRASSATSWFIVKTR